MVEKVLSCAIITLFCLSSCAQDKPIRVETETIFANLGNYNLESNCLLYSGVDVDDERKEITSSSVRVKFLGTGEEVTLQYNTLTPAIGWLDSSHVLMEAATSIGEQKAFGNWKGYLIRYDVFTHQQDTLPSPWYTSFNSVENFLTSSNRLFYTIAYGSEKMKTTHWIEYVNGTREGRVIKKYDNHSFSILTYQYLPETDEIIYVKGQGGKKELIRLSLATGAERIIKTLPYRYIEESSTVIKGKFYFIVRELPEDHSGHVNWKKVKYILKSFDLKTGLVSDTYTSNDEISKISAYQEGMILISIQASSDESNIMKSFDLKAGGEVTVGFDATSHLYALKLKD